MPGKRVLILSTDLGGGHDALAAGIRREILDADPTATVEIDNGLRIASPELNEYARRGYKSTVERTPYTYQLWFWILSATAVARIMRWSAWRAMKRRILARIAQLEPDVVVSTYPFLTAVLGKLRREDALRVPAVGMLIDSAPHDLWIAPGIDLHIALNPNDVARVHDVYPTQSYYPLLHATSVRPPVDPRCHDDVDVAATRAEFGLPAAEPVLLISGGSWGLALRDADVTALLERTRTFLAIATGRNDELADRLERELPAERARIIRFTDRMPALLGACDAALLNAGGMTCYECFALGTPVVLYDPLPGHGRAAARALDDDMLATHPRTRDELVAHVAALADPSGERTARATRARALYEQPPVARTVLDAQLRSIPAGQAATTTLGRLVARRMGALIAVAAALGLVAALWAQRAAIASFNWHLDPLLLATALVLFALGPWTQAVAFWLLLRLFGAKGAPLGDALAVWSWSALARYAPTGTMLFVVRLRESERLTANRWQITGASLYEQVLAAVGAGIVSAVAFAFAPGRIPGLVAAVAVIGVAAIVAARPAVLGGRILARINQREVKLPQLPRGRGLMAVVALNAAGWVGTGVAAATMLNALSTRDTPDVVWVLAVYSAAWLAGYLMPLAPGGLGIREGVLAALLAPHFGSGVAVSLALALRVVHTLGDLLASALIELTFRVVSRRRPAATALQQAVAEMRELVRRGVG